MIRPVQDDLRERLSKLPPGDWYYTDSHSERTALAFMFKRGEVERKRGLRCALEYRIARPVLSPQTSFLEAS